PTPAKPPPAPHSPPPGDDAAPTTAAKPATTAATPATTGTSPATNPHTTKAPPHGGATENREGEGGQSASAGLRRLTRTTRFLGGSMPFALRHAATSRRTYMRMSVARAIPFSSHTFS